MSTFTIDPEVFRMLVLSTSTLVAKMLLTNMYSAIPSGLSGYGPPEDSWLWKRLAGVEQTHGVAKGSKAAPLNPSLIRARRVVQNDLENVPISIIALWMAAACASNTNTKDTNYNSQVIFLIQLFTASRLVHTATYYMGVTGLRTGVFLAGWLSIFRAVYLACISV